MGASKSKSGDNSVKEENKEESKEEQQEDKKEENDEEERESSSDEGSDEEISPSLDPTLERQDSSEHQYAWEQKIIEETLMKKTAISKAAIVGLDGALKAWNPPDFIPDNQAIQDIIDGFNGDVSGLLERLLAVGCGVKVATPAKIEKDVAIFGNNGKGGGTSAFKTTKNIIIVVFDKHPTAAHRLAMRTASFMKDHNQ